MRRIRPLFTASGGATRRRAGDAAPARRSVAGIHDRRSRVFAHRGRARAARPSRREFCRAELAQGQGRGTSAEALPPFFPAEPLMRRPCGTEGRSSAPFRAHRGRAEARRMHPNGAQIAPQTPKRAPAFRQNCFLRFNVLGVIRLWKSGAIVRRLDASS